MANSNTEHSRKLRAATAAKGKLKMTRENIIEVISVDKDMIRAIKSGIASVPMVTKAEKLLFLIDFWEKNRSKGFPKPVTEPLEHGQDYFFVSNDNGKNFPMQTKWQDLNNDFERLDNRIIHLTQKECELHCVALNSFNIGEY